MGVENMADSVFRLVQGNRQKIADNYLSLKAYAATAADKITDYLSKGKGRNLMSVGDLLQTVAALSTVKAHAAAGEGFGSPKIPLIFSGKNMQINGALEVDKVADKAGNYVFVNGHAVGLSSKLSDFASLAVHMTAYERTLARLTGKLSTKKKAGKVLVTPPEWEGN